MPTALRAAHAALVETLAERGLLSPRWREVWEAVPRHLFIPPHVWRQGPDRCEPVGAGTAWRELVGSDEPIVTQLDDGRADGPGTATSANSKPSMVAAMLNLLDIHDGQRVLEIGTATGHVAALLSERLGDDHVVSVEIDHELTRQAAKNLTVAGYAPTVVTADGEKGWPAGAPYDRLIATCALRHVPYELVRQVRPGGIVVAPMAREFWSGALVRLSVLPDGTASGPFGGGASYMPMRSHRAAPAVRVDESTARAATGTVDPRRLLGLGFALYAGARLPGVSMTHTEQNRTVRVWLQDKDGSGAFVERTEASQVWQYGPRGLWAELERVYAEYVALGRPAADAFGLTVTARRQDVWLRSPDTVIAPTDSDRKVRPSTGLASGGVGGGGG